MRFWATWFGLVIGCVVDAPVDTCARPDVDALAELEGARRHGCLDPVVLPAWAAVPRIDDAATLSALLVPFDVGEGRWLKFVLDRTASPRWTWFINGAVFGPHWELTRAIGCESDLHEHRVLGEIGWFADQLDENGAPGRFYFALDGNPPADFDVVALTYSVLRERIPIAADLTYVPGDETQLEGWERERDRFDAAPFAVVTRPDSAPEGGVAVLHEGVGFGWLRRMSPREIPSPTDIPVYDQLPNDLPPVAGILTTTPQAALAHVNLRASQDGIPNAYVPPALLPVLVEPWLDGWVRLEARDLAIELRAATPAEVDRHFARLRPDHVRRPRLDASVVEIRPMAELGFADAPAFGAKAANLAELHRVGLEARVPEGVALSLGLYLRFMEATTLERFVDDMLDDLRFRSDLDWRRDQLAELRERIERATMPRELYDLLGEVQRSASTPLRCRSSTNAEDLADFNGAGIYESYTHRADEGHLSRTVQQVYAGLWTERAVAQRELHRVDHRRVAMGVVIHPNFDDEQVNGVAVSDDVLYRWREGTYYLNAQLGEDLVTNPDGDAIAEELYLSPSHPEMPFVIRRSSLVEDDDLLMSDAQLAVLTRDLGRIHAHFERLYSPTGRFAMEIELKVDASGDLVIKQARPWVYPPGVDHCR